MHGIGDVFATRVEIQRAKDLLLGENSNLGQWRQDLRQRVSESGERTRDPGHTVELLRQARAAIVIETEEELKELSCKSR